MNDDRQNGRRPGDGKEALGAALGEAVARETDSPIAPPPVTNIAERAAARAKARRVRHGAVSIAAAAALIAAGLAAWNTLGSDGERVVTGPTAAEPAEQTPADGGRAEDAGPASGGGPAETAPAGRGPAANAGPANAGPANAGPAEPAGPEAASAQPAGAAADTGGAEAPGAEAPSADPTDPETDTAPEPGGMSNFPAPEDLSSGPALEWTEVSVDLGGRPTDSVELQALGDGRIVARVRGESGDRVAITGDGITWRAAGLPDGVFPYRLSVDGNGWAIASQGSIAADDPGRVLVSGDGGESWSEPNLDIRSEEGLPPHCVEQSAVQDVLISGDRVVVLVSLRRLLDIEALLAERGLIPEGTPAVEWRRTDDVLTVRLGDPSDWDGTDGDTLQVALDELGLTPEQLHDCDDYASGRVRVLAGDGSGTEQVADYEGWATSAVATSDGFAMVLATDTGGVRRLTSRDGRSWSEIRTTEEAYATVARGPGGTVWLGENHWLGYRIRRGDIAGEPRQVAVFDVLQPVGVLSAGPAGVVTSAWMLPDPIRDLIEVTSFEKDGYELRLDNASGGASLRDLAAGTAVYEFSAEELEPSAEPPDGVREVTEDDGSVSLAFSDPDTGEELVRFTEEDMVPDTDRLVTARTELFGPTGMPPIWIGWSADGERWGWQDAAEAFGLAEGEGLTPFSLAVGSDFVIARFNSFDVAEAMAMAESPDAEQSQSGPPSSWRARWFIAKVP